MQKRSLCADPLPFGLVSPLALLTPHLFPSQVVYSSTRASSAIHGQVGLQRLLQPKESQLPHIVVWALASHPP